MRDEGPLVFTCSCFFRSKGRSSLNSHLVQKKKKKNIVANVFKLAEEDQIINAQLFEHQYIKCMKIHEWLFNFLCVR